MESNYYAFKINLKIFLNGTLMYFLSFKSIIKLKNTHKTIFQLMRYLIGSDDKSKVFSDGKGHKQAIETFLSYVKNEIPNPFTWLEIKSVSLAGIYAQNYLNSGYQKSIF